MSELRKDPVMGRWVIISERRSQRPDQFADAFPTVCPLKQPDCPFCAGNEERVPPPIAEILSPEGWSCRALPAASPILRQESRFEEHRLGMFHIAAGVGAHEIIVEGGRHGRSLADLPLQQVADVVLLWERRLTELGKDDRFKHLMLFKNHGPTAGEGTYRHPHSQIIALPVTPARVKDKLDGAKEYFSQTGRCVFCAILERESREKERILWENDHCVVLTPYASRFPFELWIVPKTHRADFPGTPEPVLRGLAEALKRTLARLSRLLHDPPYNFILHSAPLRRPREGFPDYWATLDRDYHWHLELIPRLTRVAGFEWGTGFYINPVSPEGATRALQETADG